LNGWGSPQRCGDRAISQSVPAAPGKDSVKGTPRRGEPRPLHGINEPIVSGVSQSLECQSFSFLLRSGLTMQASLPYPHLGKSSQSWDRLSWDNPSFVVWGSGNPATVRILIQSASLLRMLQTCSQSTASWGPPLSLSCARHSSRELL
jgi:hypothetical protein